MPGFTYTDGKMWLACGLLPNQWQLELGHVVSITTDLY